MKIQISRQELLEAVNKVKTVVSSKSALPILSHILMETGDSSVRLSATDLKVSIECTADCTVLEPGVMTVSSQRIASVLAELPNADITLTLDESNTITLQCAKIETKLYSMSADEFPPIRKFEGIEPLSLPQLMLKNLFFKTSFAICMDQSRYNLTGLLFQLNAGRLIVVSTDGRRMSMCVADEELPKGLDIKVIIPSKMIHELERLLEDQGDVEVFVDESQIAFNFNRVRMVTSLIDGTFPNYEMVIPKKHDKELVFNTAQLMEATRRTRTMTSDKFNSVRLHLTENLLTLKVVTPEVGEYVEPLALSYKGPVIEIAFNPDFILEVLRHIETESVCLVLKDGSSPGMLKAYADGPLDNYVNVIMPIRV